MHYIKALISQHQHHHQQQQNEHKSFTKNQTLQLKLKTAIKTLSSQKTTIFGIYFSRMVFFVYAYNLYATKWDWVIKKNWSMQNNVFFFFFFFLFCWLEKSWSTPFSVKYVEIILHLINMSIWYAIVVVGSQAIQAIYHCISKLQCQRLYAIGNLTIRSLAP